MDARTVRLDRAQRCIGLMFFADVPSRFKPLSKKPDVVEGEYQNFLNLVSKLSLVLLAVLNLFYIFPLYSLLEFIQNIQISYVSISRF